ncbi:MAG TPA: glycosyltransferase [Acidobacteriota bacterium]|nr:glycosyltransferase [Acidobacteriota bacterium]
MDALKSRKVINCIILSPIHSQFGKLQFVHNLQSNNSHFDISFTFLERLTNTGNIYRNVKDYIRTHFLVHKNYRHVDVIHIVCFFSKIRLFLDLLLILRFRKKVIYDFHGDFLQNFKRSRRFIRWVYLLNVKLSRGVICLNRTSYFFLKRINKNVLQIFNWIEIPEVQLCNSKKEFDIVYHGRITFDKGYRVFEELARSNPSWKILLIGPISHEINQNLPDNVTHIPVILNKRVLYETILQGRVYLFPSVREGIAFSVVEAMGLGLPVVASNICSNRFLLKGNKQCLIKPDNYEGYQKTLSLLLHNEKLMAELGKANQEFLRLELSKEEYFESLHRFYSLV